MIWMSLMLTVLPGIILLFQIHFQWAPCHWILIHYGWDESFCKIRMIPPAFWPLLSCWLQKCLYLVTFAECVLIWCTFYSVYQACLPLVAPKEERSHWTQCRTAFVKPCFLCHSVFLVHFCEMEWLIALMWWNIQHFVEHCEKKEASSSQKPLSVKRFVLRCVISSVWVQTDLTDRSFTMLKCVWRNAVCTCCP